MNIDLAGKKAVVAGGSRGIGRAIALIFAEAGADVSICARGAEALAKARDDIARLGHKTHAATCDLADAAAIPGYIDEAASALGGIDVLVNNASGFGTSDDEAGWAASISVDLMATVRATRAALPYIEKSEAGSIINISSISGFRASARTPPYGAVKAAILEYTQTLAAQLARKQIRVNCIAPGSIEFPGGTWERAKNNNPPLYAAILRSIPFGRLGQPEEVAQVALFLASPLAGLGYRPKYRGRWRTNAVSRSKDRQSDGYDQSRRQHRGSRWHRRGAGRDQVRPRWAGAGCRPAIRHRRNPDGGMDEPRCRTGDPHRGASLLLVTVARKAMAKGRNLRPSAIGCMSFASIVMATRFCCWSTSMASPATPGGAAAFSGRGARIRGELSPIPRSIPRFFTRQRKPGLQPSLLQRRTHQMGLGLRHHVGVEDAIGALCVVLVDQSVVTAGCLIRRADHRPNRILVSLVALRQQRLVLRFRFGVIDIEVLPRLQKLRIEIGNTLPGARQVPGFWPTCRLIR